MRDTTAPQTEREHSFIISGSSYDEGIVTAADSLSNPSFQALFGGSVQSFRSEYSLYLKGLKDEYLEESVDLPSLGTASQGGESDQSFRIVVLYNHAASLPSSELAERMIDIRDSAEAMIDIYDDELVANRMKISRFGAESRKNLVFFRRAVGSSLVKRVAVNNPLAILETIDLHNSKPFNGPPGSNPGVSFESVESSLLPPWESTSLIDPYLFKRRGPSGFGGPGLPSFMSGHFSRWNEGPPPSDENPVCGDGKVEAGEQCEPPGTSICDANCQNIPAACGNDVLEDGEQCDPPGAGSMDCLLIPPLKSPPSIWGTPSVCLYATGICSSSCQCEIALGLAVSFQI